MNFINFYLLGTLFTSVDGTYRINYKIGELFAQVSYSPNSSSETDGNSDRAELLNSTPTCVNKCFKVGERAFCHFLGGFRFFGPIFLLFLDPETIRNS